MSSPPPYQRPSLHVARHAANATDVVDRDFDPPVPPEVRRSTQVVRLALAGVVTILVGVVGLLGGFDRAPARKTALPTVNVGQRYDAGQYRVTIDSAEFVNSLGNEKPDKAGGHLLLIEATVEVTGNKTRDVRDVLDVTGVPGKVQRGVDPGMNYVRDRNLAASLQPGLPERIWYNWEIAPGTPAPATVTVVLNGARERLTYFRFLNNKLEDRGPEAIVTVPVKDRSGEHG